MARRRQGEAEDNVEKIAISLKLPKKLLNRIDSYWKGNSSTFSGRTHFIEEACSFYLKCEKCSNCGKLNTPQSKLCSYCGNKLEGEEYLALKNTVIRELSNFDKIIESIRSYKEEYDDLNNKINWYLEKLDDRRKRVVSVLLPDYYAVINIVMRKVDSFFEYHNFYQRLFESGKPLPSPRDVSEEKYPTIPDISIGAIDDPVSPRYKEIFDEILSIGINHSYYRTKYALSNLDTVSTQDLKMCHISLVSDGLYLQSYLDDMILGLRTLRGIEKMIDFLPDIEASDIISISRRELQD